MSAARGLARSAAGVVAVGVVSIAGTTRAEPSSDASPARPAPSSDASPANAAPRTDGSPASAPATAPSDLDRARDIFKEGRELAQANRYEEACEKFQASLALDRGIGTLFNLADCQEHLGKNASAFSIFRAVADRAEEAKQTDRAELARGRAAALESKLDYLVVDVDLTSAPSGLAVSADGEALAKEKWGQRVPIDPGKHAIVTSAPGKKTWTKNIDVPEAGATSVVTIPDLAAAEPTAEPAPASRAPPAGATPAEDVPAPRGHDNTVQLFLLGGVGAGVIAAGAGFAAYSWSNNDAKHVCPTSVNCTASDVSRHAQFASDARTARAIGFVGVGVSVASLATAGIIWLVRHDHHESPAAFRAGPVVGNGNVGAELEGSF
ncbi:MAG TPA: hypothetical protein VH142_06550 [Polyangiaceae bacterium]|jgi:hypothetical protein|nr:hypothetical protein [Polyangiaceae bacterium]